MKHIITLVLSIGVAAVFFGGFLIGRVTAPHYTGEVLPLPNEVACTADAMECPDGSYVGRSGPNCEFVCPSTPTNTNAGVEVTTSLVAVASPLVIEGTAPGNWFFEATLPVTLTNWDGLIIAEGYATAAGEWMTTDPVSFTSSLTFASPYQSGDPSFMEQGTLIIKRDNPSGLPENDASFELPVTFAPTLATP
jgi:hypothetical protein